ncbi:MAG: selenium cofactor biosynthesis protein YqeC [Bacteroidota bacterium]
MDLPRALRLMPSPPVTDQAPTSGPTLAHLFLQPHRQIAFVGAGGKTTAIFQLARSLIEQGEPAVIITATSHLGTWQIPLAGRHIVATRPADLDPLPERGITLITGPLEADRTRPLSPGLTAHLSQSCLTRGLRLLIEADGSRSHPLKAPAGHEPPIPGFVDLVIVIAGLEGIGYPLASGRVHRPERFAALTGLRMDKPVTPEAIISLLLHPEGGLKNIPVTARRLVLLNQADTPEAQAVAGRMARPLLHEFDSVVVGSLRAAVFQTFERTAGIILAAGESTRFSRPKQLLDWRGQPFVRAVALAALGAGLEPVIAVTGAYGDQVTTALHELPLQVAYNAGWKEGQGASIRAGLEALARTSPARGRDSPGGAIFLLVDQPQISVSVLKALVEAHAADLPAILAPLVLDRRANPVLFDRRTFPALMGIQGDVGGRAIFDRYPVEYLPWHDERLLLDVDTPEQYARLLEDEDL